MKHLNDQLFAQIMALRNTQRLPPLSDGTTDMETQDDDTPKARGDAEQPPLLFRSDPTAGQIHLIHMRDQHDHTWRKIEKFICVQDLNKLIQKRVEEAWYSIMADLEPLPSILPTPPSLRTYWSVNFQKNLRLRPLITTLISMIQFNISVSIRIRW